MKNMVFSMLRPRRPCWVWAA